MICEWVNVELKTVFFVLWSHDMLVGECLSWNSED
jgi:hypothetical protein